MAAIYAPGTVRARRGQDEGDVRGYRPPVGWTTSANRTPLHRPPFAAWWLIETKV